MDDNCLRISRWEGGCEIASKVGIKTIFFGLHVCIFMVLHKKSYRTFWLVVSLILLNNTEPIYEYVTAFYSRIQQTNIVFFFFWQTRSIKKSRKRCAHEGQIFFFVKPPRSPFAGRSRFNVFVSPRTLPSNADSRYFCAILRKFFSLTPFVSRNEPDPLSSRSTHRDQRFFRWKCSDFTRQNRKYKGACILL